MSVPHHKRIWPGSLGFRLRSLQNRRSFSVAVGCRDQLGSGAALTAAAGFACWPLDDAHANITNASSARRQRSASGHRLRSEAVPLKAPLLAEQVAGWRASAFASVGWSGQNCQARWNQGAEEGATRTRIASTRGASACSRQSECARRVPSPPWSAHSP